MIANIFAKKKRLPGQKARILVRDMKCSFYSDVQTFLPGEGEGCVDNSTNFLDLNIFYAKSSVVILATATGSSSI
jgi:hypothetical protein